MTVGERFDDGAGDGRAKMKVHSGLAGKQTGQTSEVGRLTRKAENRQPQVLGPCTRAMYLPLRLKAPQTWKRVWLGLSVRLLTPDLRPGSLTFLQIREESKRCILNWREVAFKTSRHNVMPDLIRHLHPCLEDRIQRSAKVGRCRIKSGMTILNAPPRESTMMQIKRARHLAVTGPYSLVQREARGQDCGVRITSSRSSVMSLMAQRMPSRPRPESFTPP